MQDFEKLGVFYLGRVYDLEHKAPKDDLILYDSKDLTTHAVCVGMTGSGKTGLCISLLEEAAIDGIPALVIDPKGDLSNLLLTFPQLRGEDFAPWVNESDAKRQGMPVAEFAKQQADLWKQGLAEWGQDGARIQRLRDSADFAVYTPGSNAGLPVSVLKSFAAPEPAIRDDSESFRERIGATATSLLALLNIEADPLQSREHILLSTILNAAWKDGKDLDLAALIGQLQTPPVSRIGILDLESFFPAKERFALAMRLNNLLAAPGFEAWMEGVPLNIDAFLHTAEGKPRVSIFSISHLTDAERMFFVTLLLGQTLGWMRTQPGTSSLRALLYMDEIFGYFPPVANPPSKGPLLTLLKQARAFGLGVVLATQNPVDLDYKGLSNAGTWFIGRLQTERDKLRVLEGLEGAAASTGAKFDRARIDQVLSGLGNRLFLMNNVHEEGPEVFQVRWALSYLRGPLTRQQIKALMGARETASEPRGTSIGATRSGEKKEKANQRPLLPPEVPQFFVPIRAKPADGAKLLYRPLLLGFGDVYFQEPKLAVDFHRTVCLLAEFSEDSVAVPWKVAAVTPLTDADLERDPAPEANYAAPPPEAAKAKSYDGWKKSFADNLYRQQKLDLFKVPSLNAVSRPGESERDFRIRLQLSGREERDLRVEKLRQKYAPKLAALDEKIRRAAQAVAKEQEQAQQSNVNTAVSFGTTLLGALLGRKKISVATVGKAGTSLKSAGRSVKEAHDVERAKETVEALQQQHADLEAQLKAETDAMEMKNDPITAEIETLTVKPKKSNISVQLVALVWMPHWQQANGTTKPAW